TKAGSLELPAWLRIAAVPVALVAGGLAFQLVRSLRRSYVARTGAVAEYDDSKPFVLYLRSFNDDAAAARATGGANQPVLPACAEDAEDPGRLRRVRALLLRRLSPVRPRLGHHAAAAVFTRNE